MSILFNILTIVVIWSIVVAATISLLHGAAKGQRELEASWSAERAAAAEDIDALAIPLREAA